MLPCLVHVKGQLPQPQPKKGIKPRGQAKMLRSKTREDGRGRRLCMSVKTLGPTSAVGTRTCPSKPFFVSLALLRNWDRPPSQITADW